MLERPSLSDQSVLDCLKRAYNLNCRSLDFLPLGADLNTAVFRAEASGGQAWFVKLRRGALDEAAIRLPHWLAEHGVPGIIPPLEAQDGALSVDLPDGGTDWRVVVYPFIPGQDGYQAVLTEAQWRQVGRAVSALHACHPPAELTGWLPREDYNPRFCQAVRRLLQRAMNETFADPTAAELAAFMRQQAETISQIISLSEKLAKDIRHRPLAFVICHADLHPGNLHLAVEEKLYLVDWDTLILAPKERDLMFIGGGFWPNQPEELFFQGYGKVNANPNALAYFRLERIVQDFAAVGEMLLDSTAGGADRVVHLGYFKSNFIPGGTIEATGQL